MISRKRIFQKEQGAIETSVLPRLPWFSPPTQQMAREHFPCHKQSYRRGTAPRSCGACFTEPGSVSFHRISHVTWAEGSLGGGREAGAAGVEGRGDPGTRKTETQVEGNGNARVCQAV